MDTRLWETVYGDGGEHVSHVSGNVSSAVSSAVSSPRSQAQESGLNSLEYWDYSVELECITGQQGRLEFHTLKEETTLSVVLSAGGGPGASCLLITDRCSKWRPQQ